MLYPRITEKAIVVLAAFALATLLLVWYATLYPFVFPKVWLFRVTVEIMALLYIPLWFSYPEYRPKKSLVWIGVGVYLVSLAVSMLAGVSLYKSFWSNSERMEGLFGILHYAAFAYVLAGVARRNANMFPMLYKVTLGVGAVSVIAAVFKMLDSGYMRLEGIAGNPSFFASQLLLSLVIALLLAALTTGAWRTLSLTAAPMFLVALFATGTRGAFLGVTVGSAVSFVGIGLYYKHLRGFLTPRRLAGIATALVVLLLLGGLWIMRHRSISLQDANIRSRITAARISIAAWRERLLWGWGPENYNVAFNKYIDPKLIQEFSQRQWFDRAHNKLLDALVMGGIIGLAAYLFFFGSLLWAFWHLKNKRDGGIWTALLGIGGLAAYFVHNLFVFDVYQSYLLLFLLVGFLASTTQDASLTEAKNSALKAISLPLSTSLLLAVLVVAPTLWFGSVKPLKASMSVGNALGLDPLVNKRARTDISDDLRFRAIVGEYQKAISYNSYVTWEALLLLERFYVGELRAGRVPYDENLLTYLEARLNDARTREPQKYEAYLALGEVLNTRASYGKSRSQGDFKAVYERASAALAKAVELAPNVPRVWYAKGTLHMGLAENQEAILAFRKAVELNPDIAESQWTLASAYVFLGRYQEAADTFDEAQRRGYEPSLTYEFKQLFEAYAETMQYEKVERVLLKLIEREPKNAKWHAVLAATYKGMGRYAEARAEVKKAVELDASFGREAEVFLRTLEK